MSNRQISQGVFSKQQQKSGNIHINVKHKDIVGRGMIVDVDFGNSQQEREECLGNAALIIDTFETYNKCHKLPSELLEEKLALVDVCEDAIYVLRQLNDFNDTNHIDPSSLIIKIKALLTKIENKDEAKF